MKKRALKSAAPWLFLIPLSGCVGVDNAPYPADWGVRYRTTNACNEITGRYSDQVYDQGAGISAAYWAFSLDRQLTKPDQMRLLPRIITLSVEGQSSIRVDYSIGNETVLSKKISAPDFKCGPNEVQLTLFDGWTRGGDHYFSFNGLSSNIVRLFRVDGYLIVNQSHSSIGIEAGFLPYFFKSRQWYRFKVADHISAPAQ